MDGREPIGGMEEEAQLPDHSIELVKRLASRAELANKASAGEARKTFLYRLNHDRQLHKEVNLVRIDYLIRDPDMKLSQMFFIDEDNGGVAMLAESPDGKIFLHPDEAIDAPAIHAEGREVTGALTDRLDENFAPYRNNRFIERLDYRRA